MKLRYIKVLGYQMYKSFHILLIIWMIAQNKQFEVSP